MASFSKSMLLLSYLSRSQADLTHGPLATSSESSVFPCIMLSSQQCGAWARANRTVQLLQYCKFRHTTCMYTAHQQLTHLMRLKQIAGTIFKISNAFSTNYHDHNFHVGPLKPSADRLGSTEPPLGTTVLT